MKKPFTIGVFVTSNVSRAHFTDDDADTTFCGLDTTNLGYAASETRFIFKNLKELVDYEKCAPETGSPVVDGNWNILCGNCRRIAKKKYNLKSR